MTTNANRGAIIAHTSVSRRTVLLTSVTGLLGLCTLTASPLFAGVWRRNRIAPFRVIYEEGQEEAIAFARLAAGRGWVVRAVRGDPTRVWYDELAPRWKKSPATVMGVTGADTLFVLERLGWDAGLRVAERTELPNSNLIAWTIASRASASVERGA
jgi:hypothetical protein